MVNKNNSQKIVNNKTNTDNPDKYSDKYTDKNISKSNLLKNKFDFKKIKLIILISIFVLILAIFSFTFIKTKFSQSNILTQDSIISQLKEQINVPEEAPIDFMRISDAKTLASQNDFYKDAKNGNYIIVYDSMALVYDFSNKKIINIKTKN